MGSGVQKIPALTLQALSSRIAKDTSSDLGLTIQTRTRREIGTGITLQTCCQVETVDTIGQVCGTPVALVGVEVHAVFAGKARGRRIA